jgi:hypothetical protein
VFGRPRATETYCRDETHLIALSGVSDFVADYEIGEMENGCSGKDGLRRVVADVIDRVHLLTH